MNRFKRAFLAASAILATAAFVSPAIAQAGDWPQRPITIVVPFTPGGLSDVSARRLAKAMEAELKQPVVVDNRPGAGGVPGTEIVARAKPDGYTLLVTGPHHIINQAIRSKMPYDAIKDFTPVAMLLSSPLMLVVHPSVPTNNLDEFMAYAKNQKGGASFGSSGVGGTSHLAGEVFRLETGAPMTHVPYKGTSPLLQDLIGGQLASTFLDEASLAPLIRENKVRPIGITSTRRSPLFPNVPTLAEQGYPKLEIVTWMGFYARAGTPNAIVQRLNAIAVKGMNAPDQQPWLQQVGAIAGTMDTAGIKRYTVQELARWQHVSKEAGVTGE